MASKRMNIKEAYAELLRLRIAVLEAELEYLKRFQKK
jgi:hypothetical protein